MYSIHVLMFLILVPFSADRTGFNARCWTTKISWIGVLWGIVGGACRFYLHRNTCMQVLLALEHMHAASGYFVSHLCRSISHENLACSTTKSFDILHCCHPKLTGHVRGAPHGRPTIVFGYWLWVIINSQKQSSADTTKFVVSAIFW